MLIELDEEEWDFIKKSSIEYIDNYRGSLYFTANFKTFELISRISHKLGDQWIDGK